ncbi:transcriptional regulator [Brevundimonas sp.]|uniref:winged helix-turn-helix domain-containing protein n=1 Tax=Brevundimonas sp. TaxID=1871086 RepID=UPI002D2363A6|nr:transcriptional regulator [Brevundimonas sp.]HYC66702.1 transcriptional regulator [Brevundimonas sp.]
MAPGQFRFERFSLDVRDRQLKRDDAPVELNARYLDALALLVREQGRLVSKDRFLEEVWRGVPVTDEALTQCVRTLRRQLGDDAGRPRFIETVPKHGYRFIAPVEWIDPEPATEGAAAAAPMRAPATGGLAWRRFGARGAAGMLGGGLAGVFIGLFYGFGAAPEPLQAGIGAASVLLVLVCLCLILGLIAGAGVGFGIAAAGFAPRRSWLWSLVGGAAGGLLTGAFGKLIGLDAFNLLFGHSPGAITGAAEGALIGGALGLGAWLASLVPGPARLVPSFAAGGLSGAAAGAVLPLLGGRLMGGSLDLLARQFPESRLSLDQIGAVFGEAGFGPVSQVVTGAIEGLLFGGWVVAAMMLARRLAPDR